MGEEEKRVKFTLEMLRQATGRSVIYPLCPYCQLETPSEPDAQDAACIHCDQRFGIDNPFF